MRFAGDKVGGGFAALGAQAGPDFGGMSASNVELRGKEREAMHAAESQTHQYGLKSVADIQAAELEADATRYAGQQAGQAAMVDGLMSGISGIASAGIQQWGAPKNIGNMDVTTPTWKQGTTEAANSFKAG